MLRLNIVTILSLGIHEGPFMRTNRNWLLETELLILAN